MKNLKRRDFIKTSALASIAIFTTPFVGYSKADQNKKILSLEESLLLKGYDDEQEEIASLVTDGNGKMWMFSLRRISYPENNELISTFHFNGKKWIETDLVTKSAGQYEAPVASCATNGKPVVAWTEIKGKDWIIRASHMKKNGFNKPHTFHVKKGRSINPILLAPNKKRNWIAWENLSNGVFTIYISKYKNGQWSEPMIIDKGKNSCFNPAIAEAKNGDLYIAYGLTDGFHQNIEMTILNGQSLAVKETIPVAIGGGRKDRVNINAKPALAFDKHDNLWISYESNRNNSQEERGDNYTGERCCAILSYQNSKIVEVENKEKWLFTGDNDHKPTFIKDGQGNLYLATYCGGNFKNYEGKFRFSWLDPQKGWQQPETLYEIKNKGVMINPAIAFDNKGSFWFVTSNEKFFNNYKKVQAEEISWSRLLELSVMRFSAPQLSEKYKSPTFVETKVKEFLPDQHTISTISGHPKTKRRTMTIDGESYTLLYGNLHEHSNSSVCWPSGTDGSLHDAYRFGMFSEGYDFFGMTDHAASTSEIHWRKNIRIADFYNESEKFVAIPAIEWTLMSDPNIDEIQYGAGHYNIIFASTNDAQKFIRNKYEIFCPRTPETKIAPMLWNLLDEKKINCVTIPHHSADKTHPLDWNVTDSKYVTTVEIFQSRGNNEYPGCPREKNLPSHKQTKYKHAYIDYALRAMKYKMSFIASGDHNGMGIGVAALWVKEINRAGIIEALQNRRTFATTGDKMFIDLKLNEAEMGQISKLNKIPKIAINVHGQYPLDKVEILRNSKVIHTYSMDDNIVDFKQVYSDTDYNDEKDVLYYYVRATQKNNALAWASPVWIERT